MTTSEVHDICTVLYTWAQGIDTRDWDVVASALRPTFEYDYSSHRPDSKGMTTATAWIDHARARFATMTATQHSMTNPRVEVRGDRATCRMYVTAWHLAEFDGREAWCTIGGEYRDELTRDGDRWVISLLRLDRRWTIGDPAVLDQPLLPRGREVS